MTGDGARALEAGFFHVSFDDIYDLVCFFSDFFLLGIYWVDIVFLGQKDRRRYGKERAPGIPSSILF